ncbi:cupin domain-containing protein [Burkholderia thailandensis]|nr:cupin domain-containing protein [Burkholderia thailandensis]AIP65096.2 cupin [Burkholderia thailandensis]AOI54830.1 cupin [Burkholderia thailandensis]AOJ53735.1 cupin [Burkholderia thailandensis]AOJ59763.1 cupin [Burkholderia thailandensis]KXF58883.1 cupin [Burkholderia thailandensis]
MRSGMAPDRKGIAASARIAGIARSAAFGAAALAAALFAAPGSAHRGDVGQVRPVLTQPLAEAPGNDAQVVTVAYAPGAASGPHAHAGSIFAFVTRGRVVSQLEGEPPRTYGPGEAWYEPPGSHHIVSRNASDTEPAQIVVFAVVGEHRALKTPLPR